MKRSGSVLIYIMVWAIVLFASFVIGICVREVRFHRARVAITNIIEETPKVNATEQPAQESAKKISGDTEESKEQIASRPEEQGTEEARRNMRERFANMSDEERAQMRERMGGQRGGSGRGMRNMSEADRENFRAEMQRRREEYLNMSEEEREQYRAEMRERTGGRRSRRDREGGSGRGQRGDRQNNNEEQQENESSDDAPPPPKGRACFVPETPVWVGGKLVQISKVTVDETASKQLCGLCSLEKVEEHEGTFECRDIVLESGNSVSVVDAHCFMLESGKWIAAQNLTNGLRLKTQIGTVAIKSVTKRTVPYTGKVYNLKVRNSDQYIVGKDMLIVRDY